MKATILVCGATGKVGGAVVDALLSAKNLEDELTVRALIRDTQSDKAKALKEKGAVLVEGSYADKESLKQALNGVRSCLLCCSNVANQVELETNVIESAEASDSCRYLVKISTCHATVEGHPPYVSSDSKIQYGRYHATIEERLANSSSLKYTTLCPNYFMQNFVGDIYGTLPRKLVAYPQENNHGAALIDARDIGAVAAKLLAMDASDAATMEESYYGQTLDVCGPKSWSIQQVTDLYSQYLDGNPSIGFVRCSSEDYEQGLKGAGFPEWMATAVARNHTVFWDAGGFDFKASPDILALLPKWRTMEEWVAEMAPLVKFVPANSKENDNEE